MLFRSVKQSRSVFDQYDKGFKLNYQVKYNFYQRKRFRVSVALCWNYQNVYFKDQEVYYYFVANHPVAAPIPYLIMRESRRQVGIGAGVGMSFNYGLCKGFYLGADISLNSVDQKIYHEEKEVIYQDETSFDHEPSRKPHSYIYEVQSPLTKLRFTFKLGWNF